MRWDTFFFFFPFRKRFKKNFVVVLKPSTVVHISCSSVSGYNLFEASRVYLRHHSSLGSRTFTCAVFYLLELKVGRVQEIAVGFMP
ncbi:hypothetical protein ACSBR2_024880 [Camellia fascicularis]